MTKCSTTSNGTNPRSNNAFWINSLLTLSRHGNGWLNSSRLVGSPRRLFSKGSIKLGERRISFVEGEYLGLSGIGVVSKGSWLGAWPGGKFEVVVWGLSSVGGVRVILGSVGLGVVRGGLGWLSFFTWWCIASERPCLLWWGCVSFFSLVFTFWRGLNWPPVSKII